MPRMYTIRTLAEKLGGFDKLTRQETTSSLPKAEERTATLPSHKLNKPGKIILSVGVGVMLILGTLAYIAQSSRFPETDFEGLLLWMAIAGAYFTFLYKIWD
jgi:hypothetical protein